MQALLERKDGPAIRDTAIGKGCRALLETSRRVADIAYECAFNNLSKFNRRFKELRDISPRRIRKLLFLSGKRRFEN